MVNVMNLSDFRKFEYMNEKKGVIRTVFISMSEYDKIRNGEEIELIVEAQSRDPIVVFANYDCTKYGYWFLLDECANEGVYCSVCHKKVYKTMYANQKLKSKYCPNCGAVMSEKEK